MTKNKPFIYLATAYSAQKAEHRAANYDKVNHIAAKILLRDAAYVISPISHGHPINLHANLKGRQLKGWDYWEVLDKALIDICDELWVVADSKWEKSKGVKAELEYAKGKGMPIKFVDNQGLETDV